MYKMRIKKIHIRKRTLPQWLAVYLFLMPFLLNAIMSAADALSVVKYTLDAAWIGLLAITLGRSRVRVKRKLFPLLCIVLGFFLYCLVVYCFRFQTPAYFLWGLRNNFRFYVAFFAFAVLMDDEDAESAFRSMDILFWVNVAVSLFQFFVLEYKHDNLGGIFGEERGCNGYTIVFFSFVLTRSALLMMTQKRKSAICVLQFLAASVIAAMAELKAFFLILALILVLAMVMTNFSWKKCLLALLAVGCLSMGSMVLVNIFGSSSDLTVENIMGLILAENYATANDLGRLTAVPTLSRTILTAPLDQIFGLGLGNCDTSSFAICNTPFYETYSYLNYNWLSSAFLFLETGYIGLTLYTSFFVACAAGAWRQLVHKNGNALYCRIAIMMSIICVVLMIYNSSLRTEIGYLAYFALALPFIEKRLDSKVRNVR